MATFAERLKIAMEARGLGYNDVDRAMGRDPGYVSKVIGENRKPRADSIEMLATALRVRVAWLLTGEGAMEAPVPEREDRFPARAAAIAFYRGKVPTEVLDQVADMKWSTDEDPGLAYWAQQIEALSRGRGATGPTKPAEPSAKVGALTRRTQRKGSP